MKTYTAKTVDDALELASTELGVEVDQLIYEIKEEKRTLLSKKAVIEVYELSDAIIYTEDYLKKVIESLGIDEVKTNASLSDDVIRIEINTNHNPIIIGKNGITLQALNELCRLAVSSKFKRKFRILLDVGNYKDAKYSRIARLARSSAKQVQKTHIDVTLDPMPGDERRVVHNALNNFSHIKTESSGEGKLRAVSIKYVD